MSFLYYLKSKNVSVTVLFPPSCELLSWVRQKDLISVTAVPFGSQPNRCHPTNSCQHLTCCSFVCLGQLLFVLPTTVWS